MNILISVIVLGVVYDFFWVDNDIEVGVWVIYDVMRIIFYDVLNIIKDMIIFGIWNIYV